MTNKCVCCGEEIPEGTQVCYTCEKKYGIGVKKKRTCDVCGAPLPKGRARYCSHECYKEAGRMVNRKPNSKKNKYRRKPDMTLDKVCDELERYNRKHGTSYSYGKYTYLKDTGQLE